jgi:hypothetical protein
MLDNLSKAYSSRPTTKDSNQTFFLARWFKSEKSLLLVLLTLAALTWLPRLKGPLDMRWDAGVYYILGTSIAEGKGYKLLNEPGEIDAVQYPPLLPLIIAGHQLILQTSDPTTVGQWLRFSFFFIFMAYIYAVFRLTKTFLPLPYAFLATLFCLLTFQVYFLSDLCFSELPFSLTTILFFLCNRKSGSRAYSIGAYIFAVASYGLRSIGIAVLMVWVLDSLIKRKLKQAIVRLALIIIPVACWQFYIAYVESSYQYNHPAYSYQRAPYLFYNVTYARNLSLEDPFAPEKGKAQVVRRVVKSVIQLPAKLGESIISPYYLQERLLNMLRQGKMIGSPIILRFNAVMFYIIGFTIIAGLLLQLFQRQFVIPVYVLGCLSAICLTPFLSQYLRYLMPITPFLVSSLIISLSAVKRAAIRNLTSKWSRFNSYIVTGPVSLILLIQTMNFTRMYFQELKSTEYADINNKVVKQRLFFGGKWFYNYNLCMNYLRQHAQPSEVAASGTPHWVYLQTGLKAVMPPFNNNPAQAQQQLDSVPVTYLIIGKDVIDSERYALPVVEKFSDKWKKVFTTPEDDWTIYQRINR